MAATRHILYPKIHHAFQIFKKHLLFFPLIMFSKECLPPQHCTIWSTHCYTLFSTLCITGGQLKDHHTVGNEWPLGKHQHWFDANSVKHDTIALCTAEPASQSEFSLVQRANCQTGDHRKPQLLNSPDQHSTVGKFSSSSHRI